MPPFAVAMFWSACSCFFIPWHVDGLAQLGGVADAGRRDDRRRGGARGHCRDHGGRDDESFSALRSLLRRAAGRPGKLRFVFPRRRACQRPGRSSERSDHANAVEGGVPRPRCVNVCSSAGWVDAPGEAATLGASEPVRRASRRARLPRSGFRPDSGSTRASRRRRRRRSASPSGERRTRSRSRASRYRSRTRPTCRA